MKFSDLDIQNFLAITEGKVQLADKGLVVIQGINNADSSADSNGAGKSSIADALCWCWFGVTARGAGGDDVVNNKAGKNCLVRSTVIDQDGTTYIATRHRKHKDGKNSFRLVKTDGFTETDLTKGTDRLTQELVEKILGCSYEVFKGAIYAGQEQMPDLPSMTDKNIKLILEEAAGVTILEEAYRKARDNAALSGATVTMAQNEITTIETSLNSTKAALTSSESAAKDWESQKVVRLDTALKSIEEVKTNIAGVIGELKLYDTEEIVKAVQDCDDKLAATADNNKKLDSYQKIISGDEVKVATTKAKLQSFQKEEAKLVAELANVNHKVGCPCSECGREITAAEIDGARTALEKKLDDVKDQVSAASADLLKADADLLSHKQAVDKFRASLPDLSAVVTERQQHAETLAKVQSIRQNGAALKERLNQLSAQLKDIEAEPNPHHATMQQLKDTVAKSEDLLVLKQTALETAKISHEYDLEVVKVYSPSGVRAHIMDEVTPYLNTQTAKYLGVLSDGNINATWTTLTRGAKGDLKEKFSIDVENATGGGNFKLLSGGEKRKVRVATSLALQDLVSTRATKPIDLFIGDEIDDALDPAGLERLTVVLQEKALERGSVFIISHNELRDYVQNVLVVEKNAAGETTITEMAA